MTAPRIPLFQRKGPSSMPPVTDMGGGSPHPEGSTQENKNVPDDGGLKAVTCPNCQCEFDPESGDVLNAPEGGMPSDDGSMDGQMNPQAAAESYAMPPDLMPMGGEG